MKIRLFLFSSLQNSGVNDKSYCRGDTSTSIEAYIFRQFMTAMVFEQMATPHLGGPSTKATDNTDFRPGRLPTGAPFPAEGRLGRGRGRGRGGSPTVDCPAWTAADQREPRLVATIRRAARLPRHIPIPEEHRLSPIKPVAGDVIAEVEDRKKDHVSSNGVRTAGVNDVTERLRVS